mgnify:CR=1 FL=1
MSKKSQHNNILLAVIGFTAVVILVGVIGFFTLEQKDDTIQGEVEVSEYRVSCKLPGRVVELRVQEGDYVHVGDTLAILEVPEMKSQEQMLQATNAAAEAMKDLTDAGARKEQIQGAYHIIETNEMHSLTEELVARAISEDRQIRAVYMSTQPVSGCIAGLRRAGVGSGVHVVCNDLTPAAKRYLKEGTVDFVIGQSFWQESFRAVIAMYQLLARNITPKETAYYTDLTLVCKEML